MKLAVKILLPLVFLTSIASLIWINTGNHVVNTGSRLEPGYTTCEGDGFISQQELDQSVGPGGFNPGGPCLGTPTSRVVSGSHVTRGRYANTAAVNVVIGMIAGTSLAAYLLLMLPRTSKKL